QVIGTMRTTTGRNAAVAEELKAAGAQLVELDVTSEESVNTGVEKAMELLGGLDVVINNAGVGVLGMQEHFTPDDMKFLFDVNVFGVQRVNRAAIPHLRQQGQGALVHVSSLLGRMALPFYGPYNASKWALEALAENYRVELSGFGIESLVVEPGGYPTTFMDNLLKPSDQSRDAQYGDFLHAPQGMLEAFEGALASNPAQNPQDVADAIVNLLDMPVGEKPFRTVVDKMGMGTPITGYNDQIEQITHGIYSNFGIEGMMKVGGK
ncbi:MAG: SDR family NAD(P)-dependent oxidoreductase, partial [Bacteroidota bacterium]